MLIMGCLQGKTKQQKHDFFKSLFEFSNSDLVFYNEQLVDLEPKEREQFNDWIKNQES